MPKVVQFKKLHRVNHFKKIRAKNRSVLTGQYNIAETYARFTRVKARSLMRPQPKSPNRKLGLYGNLAAYSKKSKRYGQFYWKKGLYSRPGHPPFYSRDTKGSTYNSLYGGMIYKEISRGQSTIKMPSISAKAQFKGYRVGPTYKPSKHSTPVPVLHEAGGTIRTGKSLRYKARNQMFIRRRQSGTARYPARPYMEPAARLAKKEADKKMKKVMAGIRPNRRFVA